MIKEKKSVQQMLQERYNMIEQREALNIKMNAIADRAAAEKRELTAEENTEYQQHQANFHKLGREIAMNVDTVNYMNQHTTEAKSKNTLIREFLQRARTEGGGEITLQREKPLQTTGLEAGGMIPLTIQDVLPPLEMGLVFDKVGIPVQTGVVGNIQWPCMGYFEAEVQGETTPLTDTDVNLTKVAAKHARVGLTVPISNQAIMDSNSDLVSLIKDGMKKAVSRTLNRLTFSHQNFNGVLHGPFAGAKTNGTFAGQVPTFKELLAMKGAIASAGVDMVGFCFVMSEAMKATLEATPIDTGSGRMIIENGAIAGYPVFCTEFVNYGSAKSKDPVEHVIAGCFGYLPTNQHGEARLVVDPFTRAKEDITQVTLNTDWSMTTLKTEAFASYKCNVG